MVKDDEDGLQLFAKPQRCGTTRCRFVLMYGLRALPSKYMAGVGFVPVRFESCKTDTIMAHTLTSLAQHIGETETPFQVIAVNLHDSTWLTQSYTFVNGVTAFVPGYDRTGTTHPTSLMAELEMVLKHNACVFIPLPRRVTGYCTSLVLRVLSAYKYRYGDWKWDPTYSRNYHTVYYNDGTSEVKWEGED